MRSAHEALKLHVMGLVRPTDACVASLKSATESETARSNRRELMSSEVPNPSPHERVSLANNHWGSFFSKMPLRASNLPLLRDSPLICVITANSALTSIVDQSAQTPGCLSEQDISGENVNDPNFVSRGNGDALGCKDDSLREVDNVMKAR